MKTVAICVLGLCAIAICLTQRPDTADDFRSFYRGARQVGTADGVYSHPTVLPDRERGAYLPYIRIPSYALLLKPLTWLPYKTARRVWITLIVLAFAAMVPLFPSPRDRLAMALCWSMPVVYTVMLGQDIAFVIVIVLVAGRMMRSGEREFSAGLVASLLAIKPTYLLPVGLVFLAKSRRGTYGIALGTAIQLAVSFALEGSGWPFRFLSLLQHPKFDLEPRRMLNVRAIVASLSLPGELYIVASVALLAWLWISSRRMELTDALMVALPLGMIASPHSYVYDAVVLIPLFVRKVPDSIGGLAVLIALTPLPYLALMTEKAPLLLAGSSVVVAATVIAVAQAFGIRAGFTGTVRQARQIPSV